MPLHLHIVDLEQIDVAEGYIPTPLGLARSFFKSFPLTPSHEPIEAFGSTNVVGMVLCSPLGLVCFSFALLLITILFENITMRRKIDISVDGISHSTPLNEVSFFSIPQLVTCPNSRGIGSALTGICIGEEYTLSTPYASYRSNCTTFFVAFR